MDSRIKIQSQQVGKPDENSYPIEKRCSNCRHPIVVYIPKGKEIAGFLYSEEGGAIVCDYCGCQAFSSPKEEW